MSLVYQDKDLAEVENILREVIKKEGREMLHPEAVHCYDIWGSATGSDCGPMAYSCVTFVKRKQDDKPKAYAIDCQTEVVVSPAKEITTITVTKHIGFSYYAPKECFSH